MWTSLRTSTCLRNKPLCGDSTKIKVQENLLWFGFAAVLLLFALTNMEVISFEGGFHLNLPAILPASPQPTPTPTPIPGGYTCSWHWDEPSVEYDCHGTCPAPYNCKEVTYDDIAWCDCMNPLTGNPCPDYPGGPYPNQTIAPDGMRACRGVEPFQCGIGFCEVYGEACQQYTNVIEQDYCGCGPAPPCGETAPVCGGFCTPGDVCVSDGTDGCKCIDYAELGG